MKKRWIRLLSCILVLSMFTATIPPSVFAAGETKQTEEKQEEKQIGFELNGASFISSYQAPTTYPVEALPTAEDMTYPGYEFKGWYDNAGFEGAVMTVEAVAAHTEESIVLYAKWQERYYVADIPASIDTASQSLQIDLEGGGFYDRDQLDVTVSSENSWELKNGTYPVSYTLTREGEENSLTNGDTVAALEGTNKTSKSDLTISVGDLGENYPSGDYTDKLTFAFDFTPAEYTVTFNADEGTVYESDGEGERTPVTEKTYYAGTSLSVLPYPEKSGYVFIGWSTDREGNEMVASDARLASDLEVYARYQQQAPLEKTEADITARANDVTPESFVVTVIDNSGELSAEEVKAALTLKDVTSGEENESFIISKGENNCYTLSHEGGWTPGSLYKFTVAEDYVGIVSFNGYDESIDHFDFNVYKEEVNNVSFNEDIKYLSENAVGNLEINGRTAGEGATITGALISLKDGEAESNSLTGSFKYTGEGEFKAGTIIGVYSGDVLPNLSHINNTITTDGSEIGYIEVTSVEDNGTIHFKNAAAEDVLFVPDVFPLDRKNALKEGEETATISVAAKYLTFSSENELDAELGLDEDTTVDIGDFIAFEQEKADDRLYAKITGVVAAVGYYDITYVPTTLEAMKSSMDVYHEESVSGDDLLQNTDIEIVEEEVEQQAIDSGFAETVGEQIRETWVNSESYEEFCKEFSLESGASDVTVSSVDNQAGPAVAFKAASAAPSLTSLNDEGKEDDSETSVEVEITDVKCNISTKLKHFDGNLKGVHLGLEVTAEVTLKTEKKNGDNKGDDEEDPLSMDEVSLSVEIVATFEQEVRVTVSANASMEWKLLPVPHPSEFNVSCGLQIYEYTGVGLEVQAKLDKEGNAEGDTAEIQTYADYFQKAMDEGYTNISSTSAVIDTLSGVSGVEYSDDISVAKDLGERYAGLLEDIEWQNIYSKEILDLSFSFLEIIEFQVNVDFVIDAHLMLVAGVDYWYKTAKEYTFTIKVFSLKVTTETTDLVPEEKSFSAYIMGAAGIRAYLQVTFRVGVISTSVASVGVQADIGGYIELYGFLYYTVHSVGGQTTEQLMGNMYVEVGIYCAVRFIASVGNGALSYAPTIFEMTVPLLTLGNERVVVDFKMTKEEIPEAKMKNSFNRFVLPRNAFCMQYLDMVEGLDENGEYFTDDYMTKYFDIEITNPAFTLDTNTRIITTDTTLGPRQDGELIITYKVPAGYMCKEPIQRIYKLHWDNLRDGYFIAFNSDGGTAVDMICGRYDEEYDIPEAPTRDGYTFDGWYTEEGEPYEMTGRIPGDDVVLTAKWEANDTPYTVERYLQNTDGTYTLSDRDTATEKTDSLISPVPSEIPGYVTPVAQTEAVKYDGSTLIKYYYGLKEYRISFESNGDVVGVGSYKYSTQLPTPVAVNPGYSFVGWKVAGTEDTEVLKTEFDQDGNEIPVTVPAADTVYVAVWEPRTDIPYEVRYYMQNANDSGNTVSKMVTGVGSTGDTINVEALNEDEAEGFALRDGELPTGEIAADGKTVVRVFYDRLTYDLTCVLNNGEDNEVVEAVRQGASIVPEVPFRLGYDFAGWYLDESLTEEFDYVMPNKALTVYAKWEKGNIIYSVENYLQKAKESTEYTLYETTQAVAKAETEVDIPTNSYAGYTARTPGKITPALDGSSKAEVRYDLTAYTLTVNLKDGSEAKQVSLYYGEKLPFYAREGYTFAGWFTDEALSEAYTGNMPAEDLSVYAKWVTEGTQITVHHNLQDSGDSGKYTTAATETFICTESSFTAQPKTFAGFKAAEAVTEDVGCEAVVIEMNYERSSVDVIYNYGYTEGDAVKTETKSVKYGSTVTDQPTRAGYQFLGWYADEALTQQFTGGITAAMTLYAKWDALTVMYTVEHAKQNTDGTYKVVDEDILYAKSGTSVTPSVNLYEHCIIPDTITETVKGDGSLVIRYSYDLETYQITWSPNNGDEDMTPIYRYQQNIEPPVVEKEGYTFVTWLASDGITTDIPNEMPDKSLAYSAQWQTVTYTLVYDLAGGSVETANPATYTIEDNSFTLTNPTRTGYTFAGWSGTGITEISESVTVEKGSTGNRTYTANWQPTPYTITLNANGGSVTNSSVTYYVTSSSFTLAAPTRTGYTFAGWKLNNEGDAVKTVTIPYGSTGDRSYTASWTENSYTVTYQMVSGEGATVVKDANTDNQTVKYTQTFNLKGKIFERKGAELIGWSTKKGATSAEYGLNASVSKLKASGTLTLYPVWRIFTYKLRFHYRNGADPVTKTYSYYQTYSKDNCPTKQYYDFQGWTISSDANNPGTPSKADGTIYNFPIDAQVKNITDGMTISVYAVWTAKYKASSSWSNSNGDPLRVHENGTNYHIYTVFSEANEKNGNKHDGKDNWRYIALNDISTNALIKEGKSKVDIKLHYEYECVGKGTSIAKMSYKLRIGSESISDIKNTSGKTVDKTNFEAGKSVTLEDTILLEDISLSDFKWTEFILDVDGGLRIYKITVTAEIIG